MFKYPCLGFFCVGVPVPCDNGGRPFVMFGRQRTQKNSPVPRFRQLTRQNKAAKSKKIGSGPFFHVQVPMFEIFLRGCASAL